MLIANIVMNSKNPYLLDLILFLWIIFRGVRWNYFSSVLEKWGWCCT